MIALRLKRVWRRIRIVRNSIKLFSRPGSRFAVPLQYQILKTLADEGEFTAGNLQKAVCRNLEIWMPRDFFNEMIKDSFDLRLIDGTLPIEIVNGSRHVAGPMTFTITESGRTMLLELHALLYSHAQI